MIQHYLKELRLACVVIRCPNTLGQLHSVTSVKGMVTYQDTAQARCAEKCVLGLTRTRNARQEHYLNVQTAVAHTRYHMKDA